VDYSEGECSFQGVLKRQRKRRKMDNPKLGREVLDVVDFEPEQFRMTVWGGYTSCGTVACLAGTALLKSGYRLGRHGYYHRPDGELVRDISGEARCLLGMTGAEICNQGELAIWVDFTHGVERFRALVEKAEKEGGPDER